MSEYFDANENKNDGVTVAVDKYVLRPPAIFNSIHIVDIMPTP